MPSSPPRSPICLAVSLALLSSTAGSLGAQSSAGVRSAASSVGSRGTAVGPQTCSFDASAGAGMSQIARQGVCAYVLPTFVPAFNGSLTYGIAASAERGGGLRASTSVDGRTPDFVNLNVQATAFASYSDRLTFLSSPGAAAATAVEFQLLLHGYVTQSDHMSSFGALWFYGAPGPLNRAQETVETPADHREIQLRTTVVVPWSQIQASGGVLDFALDLRIGTGVNVSAPTTFSGRADFANTAGVEYVRLLSGSSDVTSQYTLGSASGRDYTVNVLATTTPEPGTWALLGTGLVGLVGVTRRQRTAA